MTQEKVQQAASNFIDGLLGATQAETDLKNAAEEENQKSEQEMEEKNTGLSAALATAGQDITTERETMPVQNNDRDR